MAASLAFKLAIADVQPPGYALRPDLHGEFFKVVVALGLEVKDKELAAGLDAHGVPLHAISQYTREHRKSAMGPADPNAPPLTPAYGLSRTRSLLDGRAHVKEGYALFFWRKDAVTGKHWGQILGYHRAGKGKLPVRDVIGLSPAGKAEVAARARQWWETRVRHNVPVPTPAKVPTPAGPVLIKHVPAHKPASPAAAVPKANKHVSLTQIGANVYTHHGGSTAQILKAVANPPTSGFSGFKKHAYDAAGNLTPAGQKAKLFGAGGYAKFVPPGQQPPPTPPAAPPAPAPKGPKPKPAPKAKAVKPPAPTPAPTPAPAAAPPAPAEPKKVTPPAPAAMKPKAAPKPPPAPKAPAKPAPAVGAWPAEPNSLTVVKKLGGASGAEQVKDASGQLYVRKKGTSADHLREETYADAIYRAAGVPVPQFRRYDLPSGPVKLSKWEDGVTLAELMKSDPAAAEAAMEQLRKHFVVDALLANWDVIGAPYDNILVTKAGVPLRIDNGGALRFRGFQGKKPSSSWPGTMVEIDTLRSPNVNPATAKVFGKLTDEQVRKQAKELLKKRDAILAATPDELKPALVQRLDRLKEWAEQGPPKLTPGWTPRPASDFRKFATAAELTAWGESTFGAWGRSLTAAEHEAIAVYTGSGHRWMNSALYAGDYKGLPKADVDRHIATLRAALDRAKLPEAIVTKRGVGALSDLGVTDRAQLIPGAVVRELGFSSTSPTRPWGKPVIMTMRLPAGRKGAWVNVSHKSQNPGELELLLPPGGRYRVISHQYTGGVDHLTVEAIP